MGNYVEQNLNKSETLIKKAELSKVALIIKGIKAVICLILLIAVVALGNGANTAVDSLDPTVGGEITEEAVLFATIVELIRRLLWLFVLVFAFSLLGAVRSIILYINTELAVTSKRIIGKRGVIKTTAMDAPLDKVQNVSASSGLFGKIFHYGKVEISMASLDSFTFDFVREPEAYKRIIMEQIDQYEQHKSEEQAQRMATMFNMQNNQPNTTEG